MRLKKTASCLLALFILLLSSGCGASAPKNSVFGAADLTGRAVGVLAGSEAEAWAAALAQAEIISYDDPGRMISELRSGGLDAVLSDRADTSALLRGGGVRALGEPFLALEYRIAVSQDNGALLKKLNSAIVELNRSGWQNPPEGGTNSPAGEFGESLTAAVAPDMYPYAYRDEKGELRGRETEAVRLICRALGVNAEFREVERDRLVYMAESGKVSFSIGRLTRQDDAAVSWSNPYMTVTVDIIVRK